MDSNIYTAKREQIESHLKILKDDRQHNGSNIQKILSCLVGDDINGQDGLVSRVKHIDKNVNDLKEKVAEHSYTIIQLKFVVGLIVAGIIGYFFTNFLK